MSSACYRGREERDDATTRSDIELLGVMDTNKQELQKDIEWWRKLAHERYSYIEDLKNTLRNIEHFMLYQDTYGVYHCHYCGIESYSLAFFHHLDTCIVHDIWRVFERDPEND